MTRFRVLLAVSCLLTAACASPVPDLWPPGKDDPFHTIIVSVDTWHAMIAFPRTEDSGLRTEPRTEKRGLRTERKDRGIEVQGSTLPSHSSVLSPQSSDASPSHSSASPEPVEGSSALSPESFLYEEWGYAEKAWYVEGRMGVTGVIRALFWPSQGVVEVGRYTQVWAERTPQPPAERFTFRLTNEGYQRLRRHLQSTKAKGEPVARSTGSKFYPAIRSYHVFHQCHHYGAHALRAAGLPVSPFWALTRGMFAAQLRRAEELDSMNEATLSGEPGQT